MIASRYYALLFAIAALSVAGQQGHFTVDIKPTAGEQLRYANALEQEVITKPHGTPEYFDAVGKAAAALDVVVAKWPDRIDDAGRACAEKAHLLLNEQMYSNAIAVCNDVRGLDQTPYGAVLHRLKGSALLRTQRYGEAEKEFDAADHHPKSKQMNSVDRATLYNEMSWLNERLGRFPQASACQRRAAGVDGQHSIFRALAFLKSVELNMHGSNEPEARADLHDLDAALASAWQANPSPEEASRLRSIESESKKWHKKLGV